MPDNNAGRKLFEPDTLGIANTCTQECQNRRFPNETTSKETNKSHNETTSKQYDWPQGPDRCEVKFRNTNIWVLDRLGGRGSGAQKPQIKKKEGFDLFSFAPSAHPLECTQHRRYKAERTDSGTLKA